MEDSRCETPQLIAYAKIDREIHRLFELLEALPPELKQDIESLRKAKETLDTLQTDLNNWKSEKTKLDSEEQEEADRAAVRKGQLGTIHNMKEYQAALKEIDDTGKRSKERTAQLLLLTEKIEQAQTEHSTLLATYTELETKVADQTQTWETERKAIQADIEAKKAELHQATQNLSDSLLKRYMHIAKLRQPALAIVERGVCQECYIQLPPQEYIQLQKNQGVSICPSCQRLLYLPA